jgi:aminopeptidase N
MSKSVTRLFNTFQPDNYNLTLDLDLETNLASGVVIIKGKRIGRPSQRLTFHGKYLKIQQATIIRHDKKLGDQTIEVIRTNTQETLNEVRLHTDDQLYAGDYTITINFTAPIQPSMHGIYRSKFIDDEIEKTVISTQFESHHAREAFPCIDEPEAKATIDLTLRTDTDQTVISNMPSASQTEADGKLTTVFETSPKMSTYLLAFVVGDLQHKTTQTNSGVSVSIYATKAHKPEALDFALDTTKRSIEFFNDYYGIPYPLPKCDMVAILDFSSAAMENWGLVTYREPYLLADPDTTSQSGKETIAMVIAHEISHQWFGNLVTMRWWNDLWLNESFANVMEYVAVDDMFPDWHIFNTFIANEGLSAFRRDSIAGVQSIKTEVHHPDEINSLFDPSIVYAKGGRLLNMLRTYIGEDDFRAGLKQYFEKHQYGNTTGDDLWEALSKTSGKDVAAFMNPWLERSGFPVVSVKQADNKLELHQKHFLMDQSKSDASRIWPVPLLATDDSVPSLLSTAQEYSNLQSSDYVRINQGAVGHYIVHYADQAHMVWVAEQAQSGVLNEAERLMLLSDSGLLARNGTDSLASTLRLLDYYSTESSEPVWDTMALIISDSRRFIDSDPSLEDDIKKYIRGLIEEQYQRLGWEPEANESNHDTKLRATILGLGIYSEHEAIKAKALELFEAYKQDENVVDSELRGIVFTAAVRHEAPDAFDYLLKLEETTSNPNLKQELLGALSATRSTDKGAMLLSRLKDSDKVRQHDIDHWLVLLMRSRYNQAQAWDWMRKEWPWIEEIFGGDKSYDYFPRYAASALNTPERVQEYKDFFTPMIDQPSLKLNITLGIEELDSRIAWIERDLPSIQDFFKG